MARGVGSALPQQPQSHCKATLWLSSGGFALKPSDPSFAAAALPLPERPPPTARDARAHRTHAGDHLRGGAPHGRDAGRPGQWSRAPQVILRCNGVSLPPHAGTWPLGEGFSLGLETEAPYHVWADGRGWSGSNGAGRGGRRGGFLRLRVRPWILLHIV